MQVNEAIGMLTSAATLLTAVIALYGVNAWRREHVGRRRIEFAESVLETFYAAAAAIASIRQPFSMGGEGGSRQTKEEESRDLAEVRNRAYVPWERARPHQETFDRLRALKFRAMALWRQDAGQPFDEVVGALNKVFYSASQLAQLWSMQDSESRRSNAELIRRYQRDFWESYGEPDAIRESVEAAVRSIEAICRPIIIAETESRLFRGIRDRFKA